MDFRDIEPSMTEDDIHCAHIERNPEWASISGHQVPSEDSHERYHRRHQEANDRATETALDDEVDFLRHEAGRRNRQSNAAQLLLDMQKKVQSLEQQLKATPSNIDRIDGVIAGPSVSRLIGGGIPIGQKPKFDLKRVEMVAELRETSWAEFTNKFDDDRKEYAIEVLMEEPDYRQISRGFNSTFDSLMEDNEKPYEENADITRSPQSVSSEPLHIPDRIRINSPHILNALATMDKNLDASAPIVMLRPFKFLIHCETKIRDFVRRVQNSTHGYETPGSEDESSEVPHMQEFPSLPKSLRDRGLLVQHMQCVVQFIDHYLLPTITTLKNSTGGKISFRDLWYIFPPGEDIFMPAQDRQRNVSLDPMTLTPEMFQNRYERLWRVIGTGGGRQDLSAAQSRETRVRQNPFKVTCYYIDYDGVYFGPTVHTWAIQPFLGERDILSLEFFPLRFLKKGQKLRDKSLAQGRLVFDALQQSHTHFYYSGPTLTTQPCGCAMQNSGSHQEHIDSEVIVDYRAALLKNPAWRPKPSFWQYPKVHPGEVIGKTRVRHWNDKTKSKLIGIEIYTVYDDHIIDKERALIFKDKQQIFDPIPSGWLSNEKSVPENDIGMLSGRVFAFVLRTRTFAPIWLWGLQKISAQTEGLRNLQLRDNTIKNTIHALVRTHFLQRSTQRNAEFEYDLIRGKGKGLVFLLHGAPGVGKTFTAESVAAANGRPLFQITCGDLGLTPSEVEKALKEIFRFAQLWNCVLLLDECDIFLTQRTKNDLKRNSLVSVFLRVLEWYSGVLFLTTNRVGTLDSAVKSRITWSTYYPPLDLQQTREIWKSNLNLLEKRNPNFIVEKNEILRFAKEHFERSIAQGSNWNGRQIQNAFKVAVSLAGWETYSDKEQQAMDTEVAKQHHIEKLKITASHFETVATAARTFDDYLNEATGISESQRALNAQERADYYKEEDPLDEDNSNETLQEPDFKKRRTSSAVSGLRPQNLGGGLGPVQPSNNARRLSNAQQPPPNPARKKSNSLAPPYHNSWENGEGQSRRPYGNNSHGASDYAVQPPSYDPSASRKRKAEGGQQPAPRNARTNSYNKHEEESSGSEYGMENVVGMQYPEENDDWAD